MHRVEVYLKSHLPDARGQILVRDIGDLGITTVSGVRVLDVYYLDANLKPDELDIVCRHLLFDPVTQEYHYNTEFRHQGKTVHGLYSVEIAYNAGVTDPLESSIKKAVLDLGVKGVRAVKTAKRYLIEGELSKNELKVISSRLLVNPIVQHIVEHEMIVFSENPRYHFKLKEVDLAGAKGSKLLRIAHSFCFTKDELEVITAYFKKRGHNPTDIELETLAQTWSEHCVHKTFKARIRFGDIVIDNLLKSTVMRVTEELDKPWCLSVFEDNAGVIDFDGRWALCFKVETHNHPSAVEPYGGAATGIGGVVRDILGTGLSAKPILNTDIFCFGPPDLPYDRLPAGVLHPRRIFEGVRAGVADYSNRLGIPTLNGAILFDSRYTTNPLVYCGTVGLLPKSLSRQGHQKVGDLVVLVGGRTGRDGIHGVTFASEQLTQESTAVSYTSVQIGNPIVEKRLIDALLKARDRRLFTRITDCGGGGLSSAVGEMAAETGVRVYLDMVPLKYTGLSYTEIWISESQERMVLAVPPDHWEELLALFTSEGSEATVIGEFTDDCQLKLFYQENPVAELSMEFLHQGRPQLDLEATWQKPQYAEPDLTQEPNLAKALQKILGSWNVCSKEWVIRQYDHEVQGSSVLKPLVGRDNDGPCDATILRPILDSKTGVIVSNGINPKFGDIDPYWMAASAIDESLRQIIAVGGDLNRVALLDNFCWGNTNRPESLGALVRAAQACYDMAIVYETPFISGKDSLNNEFELKDKSISIPHTLLISAISVMPDTSHAVSMDLKEAGDLIYAVGITLNELGGSEYFRSLGFVGNTVPRVDPYQAKKLMERLNLTMKKGLVRACHDLSEGGIGVAVAEMAFAGGLGAQVFLKDVPLGEPMYRDDLVLFSESNSRFLVEIRPDDIDEFEQILVKTSFACVGQVTSSKMLEIFSIKGKPVVNISTSELKEVWQKPIRW